MPDPEISNAAAGTSGNDITHSELPYVPRRGAIACRRCRRLRSKCVNENGDGKPPCRACRLVGKGTECVFVKGNSVIDRKDAPKPAKRQRVASHDGQRSVDRQHRAHVGDDDSLQLGGNFNSPLADISHDHIASTTSSSSLSPCLSHVINPPDQSSGNASNSVLSDLTPTELNEAAEIYFTSFYQVGFLHKTTFQQKLSTDPNVISPFLIFAILSLTAGASSSLVGKYGGSTEAARLHFKDKAMSMLADQCMLPSLECIQALYLLGLNDFGTGCGPRSWMLIGMGLRMVELLRLGNSDTYSMIKNTSPQADHIIAESSRRTVWSLLIADDSLAVGFGSLSASSLDVTIQTPCDEDDWDFGSIPTVITPESASRSLMGNTLSIMSLWSRAARWAAAVQRKEIHSVPWDPNGDLIKINRQCTDFLSTLSDRLKFSSSVLAVHRNRKTDMAFTHLHLLYHGTHILLRRMYLPSMISRTSVLNDSSPDISEQIAILSCPTNFWKDCAETASRHSLQAIDICLEYMAGREKAFPKGFTPLMCFVLFLGGAMMSYLVLWPSLCPVLAPNAELKTSSAIEMLAKLSQDTPVAARWHAVLVDLYRTAKHPQQESCEAVAPINVSNSTSGDKSITSPGQSDPLGVLAGLAVSQPFVPAVPSLLSTMPFHEYIQSDNQPQVGQNQPVAFDLDMFTNFDLPTPDLAGVFGFTQMDFGGL